MKKLIKFITESIAELKKVVWPSRDEVTASTKVVIVSTVLIAVVLGAIDWSLIRLMTFLF